MKSIPNLLAGLLLCCLSCRQPAAEPADTPLTAFADSLFNTEVDSGRIAGASVLIRKEGKTLLHKAFGYASLELQVPVPDNGIFEIGSVTKQFTAAAILKLASEGRLSIDEDFTKYVSMDTGGRTITIRQLLNHTSGIPSYTEIPEFWELSIESHSRDSLLRLVETKPFLFEPGERLIYNNTGYFILGLIIEDVSEKAYEDYLREAFFDPLGMDHTYYCSQTAIMPGKVYGYSYSDSGLEQKAYLDHTWPYAAGSLCSTAEDLLKWLEALHSGNVLSEPEYQALTGTDTLNDGTPVRYAKGLTVYSDYGHRRIGHGGGINGFLTDTRFYPEDNLYIICLVNTTGPKGAGYFSEALTWKLLDKTPYEEMAFDRDPESLSGAFEGQVRGRWLELEIKTTPAGLIWKEPGEEEPDTVHTYIGNATWMDGNSRLFYQGGKWHIDQVSGLYILEPAE